MKKHEKIKFIYPAFPRYFKNFEDICEAAKLLEKAHIYANVVSMPSMFLFDQQDEEYKESVLPKNLRTVAVEMGASMPWFKYASFVKGIDTFGASMPINDIYEEFGFRTEDLVEYFKTVLK